LSISSSVISAGDVRDRAGAAKATGGRIKFSIDDILGSAVVAANAKNRPSSTAVAVGARELKRKYKYEPQSPLSCNNEENEREEEEGYLDDSSDRSNGIKRSKSSD
jgi:hypothetical protein